MFAPIIKNEQRTEKIETKRKEKVTYIDVLDKEDYHLA